jgi:integrase
VVALTPQETKELLTRVAGDQCAVELDVVDLVSFITATGLRIGEACGLRPPQVELERGLIEVNATVTDFGLKERTKTEAGWRVIGVPPSIVELLRHRLADPSYSAPTRWSSRRRWAGSGTRRTRRQTCGGCSTGQASTG